MYRKELLMWCPKMKKCRFQAQLFLLIAISASCQRDYIDKGHIPEPAHAYPAVKFAVLSDPHFFSPDLGTLGEAFEEYLNKDRKLLRESSEIFKTAVHYIIQESPDFVLI